MSLESHWPHCGASNRFTPITSWFVHVLIQVRVSQGPYARITNSLPIANGTISPYLLTLAYRYVSAIVPLTSLLVLHAYGPRLARSSAISKINGKDNSISSNDLPTELVNIPIVFKSNRYTVYYIQNYTVLNSSPRMMPAVEWSQEVPSYCFLSLFKSA